MYTDSFFDGFATLFQQSESSATTFTRFVEMCQSSGTLQTWHLAWVANDLTAVSSSMIRWDLWLTNVPDSSARHVARPMAESASLSVIVFSTALMTVDLSLWLTASLF